MNWLQQKGATNTYTAKSKTNTYKEKIFFFVSNFTMHWEIGGSYIRSKKNNSLQKKWDQIELKLNWKMKKQEKQTWSETCFNDHL